MTGIWWDQVYLKKQKHRLGISIRQTHVWEIQQKTWNKNLETELGTPQNRDNFQPHHYHHSIHTNPSWTLWMRKSSRKMGDLQSSKNILFPSPRWPLGGPWCSALCWIHSMVVVTSPMGLQAPPALAATTTRPPQAWRHCWPRKKRWYPRKCSEKCLWNNRTTGGELDDDIRHSDFSRFSGSFFFGLWSLPGVPGIFGHLWWGLRSSDRKYVVHCHAIVT